MVKPQTSKPAGGLGALRGTWVTLRRERAVLEGASALLRVNQQDGFDCPGCAWPEPTHNPSSMEFCENGAKAVAAEVTSKRVTGSFFSRHSVQELLDWSDFELEGQGRLTEPVYLAPGATHYTSISWEEAFQKIGKTLNALPSPNDAIFYTSGRTSNEAAFLYQLLARRLGTNNLPDCSNLCHESSGVGLGESIGVGKGTVQLDDFEKADCILVIGQNPATNHPRMLATLQEASRRGAHIIAINPLRESGLVSFTHPKEPWATVTGQGTPIATQYVQLRVGSDIALLNGILKNLFEREDAGEVSGIDFPFIAAHTEGVDVLRKAVSGLSWEKILTETGLGKEEILRVAHTVAHAKGVIACWAMGITQHVHGVHNVQAIANLLLVTGNLGKPGAGACPVRGHSNVQGDRTMGIIERPTTPFLKKLGERFAFDPPTEHGLAAIPAIEKMLAHPGQFFMGLGGNFAQATSDTRACHAALRQCSLTVQVSTKLNRSHLVHGREALILPCLARSEKDIQPSGEQWITVEDSMGVVHRSRGHRPPPSAALRSEVAIVSGIAMAAFPSDTIPWKTLAEDYREIRMAIEAVIPGFANFESRVSAPGGFALRNAAREREWNTQTGRARIVWTPVPEILDPEGSYRLFTVRSHDQYNTTIYGLDDRYRGIAQNRMVVFMHPEDIREAGLQGGDRVRMRGLEADGEIRRVDGFQVVPWDLPRKSCAAYFPETNPLLPRSLRAHRSDTPASKCIPVWIEPSTGGHS